MAVDTALKRSSIICIYLPFGRSLPPPPTPFSAAMRAHLSRVYPGFWGLGPLDIQQMLVLVTSMNKNTTVVMLPPKPPVEQLVLVTFMNKTTTVRMPPLGIH